MTEPHVHDCTGPDMCCPCGFVFRAGRFLFELTVYDNETKQHIANESLNCDDASVIVFVLEETARQLT